MKKKGKILLTLGLTLTILAFSLVGCGGEETEEVAANTAISITDFQTIVEEQGFTIDDYEEGLELFADFGAEEYNLATDVNGCILEFIVFDNSSNALQTRVDYCDAIKDNGDIADEVYVNVGKSDMATFNLTYEDGTVEYFTFSVVDNTLLVASVYEDSVDILKGIVDELGYTITE